MEKLMKMVAALVIVAAISSNTEMMVVAPGPGDCYDACSTACVQRDSRLTARCDRKCSIKCDPDSVAEREAGGV